MAAHNIHC